jgi:hypothetical protein
MRLILLASLLAGCAMQPMTPEEIQENDRMVQAMQQGAAAMKPRPPAQVDMLGSDKTCHRQDLGNGNYRESCY